MFYLVVYHRNGAEYPVLYGRDMDATELLINSLNSDCDINEGYFAREVKTMGPAPTNQGQQSRAAMVAENLGLLDFFPALWRHSTNEKDG